MRSRIAAWGSALVFGVAGALIATPAQAQDTLEIHNSSNSVGPVVIYSSAWPAGRKLDAGSYSHFYNGDGSVRVDPDPEYGYPDVDSSWKGIEGRGYYECDPGEGLINPPNDTDGLYWKINTDKSGC